MTGQEKLKIKNALKTAYDNTIKEQDIHRDRIEVMKKHGNQDYLNKPLILNWNYINEAMADECWPAEDEDRKKFLKQNWDEIPSSIRIKQIEDKDIAAKTYFLNDMVEHCHRTKAIAKFLEVLNANPEDWFVILIFRQWTKHNVCLQLAREQLEAGNQEKAEGMQQMAEATKKLFDIFAESHDELKRKIVDSDLKDKK